MEQAIQIGTEIPEFTAKDFSGETITKEDLLGAPFVIYFYAKDDTPGCTSQACQFRDLMESFDEMNVMVVGISPDSAESHQKFMEKHELNFPLLCDEKLEIARQFGVAKPKDGGGWTIVRSTFLCDEEGVIHWVESPVKVEDHVQRVIAAIENTLA